MTLGVVLDPLHRAFGQDFALVQHGDPVRNIFDEFHVMFDHEDRATLDDLVEKLRGFHALADAHPGDRLIEHKKLGILNQQHSDLEPLLLPVAQKLAALLEMIL